MIGSVIVAVDVVDPVVVIALVNGNDAVDMIDTGVDHAHDVVPDHERGHDQGEPITITPTITPTATSIGF